MAAAFPTLHSACRFTWRGFLAEFASLRSGCDNGTEIALARSGYVDTPKENHVAAEIRGSNAFPKLRTCISDFGMLATR